MCVCVCVSSHILSQCFMCETKSGGNVSLIKGLYGFTNGQTISKEFPHTKYIIVDYSS